MERRGVDVKVIAGGVGASEARRLAAAAEREPVTGGNAAGLYRGAHL